MYCFALKEPAMVSHMLSGHVIQYVSSVPHMIRPPTGVWVGARRELDTGRLLAVGGRFSIGHFPKEVPNNGKDVVISGTTVISHCGHHSQNGKIKHPHSTKNNIICIIGSHTSFVA